MGLQDKQAESGKEDEDRMIIAVDFDGTLQDKSGKPNTALLARLKQAQRGGNIVILWTCRTGQRLNDAVAFLRSCGFVPNLINANAPEIIQRFGCDSRKIYADIYIDDKNAR